MLDFSIGMLNKDGVSAVLSTAGQAINDITQDGYSLTCDVNTEGTWEVYLTTDEHNPIRLGEFSKDDLVMFVAKMVVRQAMAHIEFKGGMDGVTWGDLSMEGQCKMITCVVCCLGRLGQKVDTNWDNRDVRINVGREPAVRFEMSRYQDTGVGKFLKDVVCTMLSDVRIS